MAAIDVSRLDLQDFDLELALNGCVLVANDTSGEGNLWYLATNFRKASYDANYPYTAVIENITYYFNASGSTILGEFVLKCTESIESSSDGQGTYEDDVYIVPGETEGTTVTYNLSKLNYKETVALDVLNALIKLREENPESISESTINLLVKKAFGFSKEFLHQAIASRTGITMGSGSGSGGGGGETGVLEFIPSIGLNSLAAVRKIYWCTQYPDVGEDGALYVKLRIKESA